MSKQIAIEWQENERLGARKLEASLSEWAQVEMFI